MCYEHFRLHFPCFFIVTLRKQHSLNHYFLHSLPDSFSLCVFFWFYFLYLFIWFIALCLFHTFFPFVFFTYPVSVKIIIFRTAPSCWFAHSPGLVLCSLCCYNFFAMQLFFLHISPKHWYLSTILLTFTSRRLWSAYMLNCLFTTPKMPVWCIPIQSYITPACFTFTYIILRVLYTKIWNLLKYNKLSSSYICHGVGPLVDPYWSHVSRSLFEGLSWFVLPAGE